MKQKLLSLLISMAIAVTFTPKVAFGVAEEAQNIQPADASQMEELLIDSGSDAEEYNGYIFVLNDDTTRTDVKEIESAISDLPEDENVEEILDDEMYVADSLETIGQVASPEDIAYIEPNYRVYAMGGTDTGICATNDTYYNNNKSAYSLINIESVWNKGVKGQGLRGQHTPIVAVIDTGLCGSGTGAKMAKHEDINYSNVLTGYCRCYGENGQLMYSTSFTDDDNGHGTFVTGEIAAVMNNSKGVTGLTPEVKIIPIKALADDGAGYASDAIEGINKAIEKNADVINMSLGSNTSSPAYQTACTRAANAGVIIVAASGNVNSASNIQASDTIYPAAYDGVIGVASVKSDGTRSSFSCYHSGVDAAAPGSSIYGLSYNNSRGYEYESGTSMACPMVASLAAMVKSVDSSITTDDFMDILAATCVDKGDAGRDDKYGYGIIDFAKAYDYMISNQESEELHHEFSEWSYSGIWKTRKCKECGLEETVQYRDPVDLTKATIRLSKTSYTYNGKAKKPTVTIDGLTAGTHFSVSYKNNIKAGKASVVVSSISDSCTGTGVVKTFTVNKATQTITASVGQYSFKRGKTISLNAKAKGKLTYKSSNTKVATVSSKGKVKIKKKGSAKITITAAATTNYKKATKTLSIKVK